MSWKKLLAWTTGQIDEAMRQKLEYVLEENRIYRVRLDRHSPHWRLQDSERKAQSEIRFSLIGTSAPRIRVTLTRKPPAREWHCPIVCRASCKPRGHAGPVPDRK
jgi:hypothetical protein